MKKLIKPAEYAKELGISRQAVYAKVKKGILTSRSVEGKLYIVLESEGESEKATIPDKNIKSEKPKETDVKDYKSLLEAKDETISVLKGTVKDLKKSNKQISSTLKGEIDLLKEAFHEMRTLYVHQLEQKSQQATIEVDLEEEVEWISLKKFFKRQKIGKEKLREKLIKRFKKAYKKGDTRLMLIEGTLKLNSAEDYKDILN